MRTVVRPIAALLLALLLATPAHAEKVRLSNGKVVDRALVERVKAKAKAKARAQRPPVRRPSPRPAARPEPAPTPPSAPSAPAHPAPAPAPTPAEQPEPLPRTLGVFAREFSLVLSRSAVAAGAVTVQLENQGEDPHDLVLTALDGQGGGGHFPTVGHGDRATQRLELHAGRYRLVCTLPGHEAAGMRAEVIAK